MNKVSHRFIQSELLGLRTLIILATAFLFGATFSFINLSQETPTSAVSATGFSAGNIISDSVMGNYRAMSTADIQAFLTSKNPCNNTNRALYEDQSSRYQNITWHWDNGHFVCLSEERFGEGTEIGSGQTAAEIIHEAAEEYRINPQVLLVLLEKEQGLITDTYPHSRQYRSATGYGCPDTAACDSRYYGFKNQVFRAAELFRYTLDHGSTLYPDHKKGVFVAYNPNRGCGGTEVYIENRATSALYRYTPYQPNSAALAAGHGMGDACSAYGNRNFYLYFLEWFGNPQGIVWGDMEAPRTLTVARDTLRFNTKDLTLTDNWVHTGENYFFDRKVTFIHEGEEATCLADSRAPETCILFERTKEFAVASGPDKSYISTTYTCPVNLDTLAVNCSAALPGASYQITTHGSVTISGEEYLVSDSNKHIGYLAKRFRPFDTSIVAYFQSPRYLKLVTDVAGVSLTSASCPHRPAGTIQYFNRKLDFNGKTYYMTEQDVKDGSWCVTPASSTAELLTKIQGDYSKKFVSFLSPRTLKIKENANFYDINQKMAVCRTVKAGTTYFFDSKINIGELVFYRAKDDAGTTCIIPSAATVEIK